MHLMTAWYWSTEYICSMYLHIWSEHIKMHLMMMTSIIWLWSVNMVLFLCLFLSLALSRSLKSKCDHIVAPGPVENIWLETHLAFKLTPSCDLKSDPRSTHTHPASLYSKGLKFLHPQLYLFSSVTSLLSLITPHLPLGWVEVGDSASTQPSCCMSDLQEMLGGPPELESVSSILLDRMDKVG